MGQSVGDSFDDWEFHTSHKLNAHPGALLSENILHRPIALPNGPHHVRKPLEISMGKGNASVGLFGGFNRTVREKARIRKYISVVAPPADCNCLDVSLGVESPWTKQAHQLLP